RLYDLSNDPANEQLLTYPSPKTGAPVSRAFMIPRSEEDLVLRREALQRRSEETFGLLGRSPDHVAAFLAGWAGGRDVFARGGEQFADNIVRFYEDARDNDWYVSYVIAPPQIDRSKPAHQQEDPHLYAGVKEEREDGSVFDYPMSTPFNETDSLLVFDDVFVPWERVFVYRNLDVVSAQWYQTAAHL